MSVSPLDQPAPDVLRRGLIHILEDLPAGDLDRLHQANAEPEWRIPNLRGDGVTLRDVGRMLNLVAAVLG